MNFVVQHDNGSGVLLDGPFVESKETVGGFAA